jgi:hypothetical protein
MPAAVFSPFYLPAFVAERFMGFGSGAAYLRHSHTFGAGQKKHALRGKSAYISPKTLACWLVGVTRVGLPACRHAFFGVGDGRRGVSPAWAWSVILSYRTAAHA